MEQRGEKRGMVAWLRRIIVKGRAASDAVVFAGSFAALFWFSLRG